VSKSAKTVEVEEGNVTDEGQVGLTEKMKSVLDLADDQPFEGFATFQQPDDDYPDDDNVWTKQFHMPAQDWDDFGRPDVITITIKPGDTLNPETD
jgi:hypothetical protein